MRIIYNSSMPRSGSTLIQNLLMQHPEVVSSPTSPLTDLLLAMRQVYSANPASKAQDKTAMRTAYLHSAKAMVNAYAEKQIELSGKANATVYIDKGRGWIRHIDLLEAVFGEKPKMFTIVRDLRMVLSSMEKNFRKNPETITGADGQRGENLTMENRLNWYLTNPPVGFMLNSLKDSFDRGHSQDLVLFTYEQLITNKQKIMDMLLEALELNPYKFNFENIRQYTQEDDKWHGVFGDHAIKNEWPKTLNFDAHAIFNPHICDEIHDKFLWYQDFFKFEKSPYPRLDSNQK